MKKRIITAVVAISLFIPICIFSDTPAFPIAFAIAALIAAYEILKCVGLHKKVLPSLLCYTAAVLPPALSRVLVGEDYFLLVACLAFLLIFLLLVTATFSHGAVGVSEALTAAGMVIYVSFAFASIVLLRDLSVVSAEGGEAHTIGGRLYLLCFLFAWMPDTGGYFIGRFFGKHKLIPDISPKKTVEGLFGGIAFAVITAVVYGFIIDLRFDDVKGFLSLIVLAVICSLVSVCGDLVASLVKRRYGVKDYGFLFPGHGGVLDRFDSVIAVAPCLYMLSLFGARLGLFSDFVALI